LDINHRLGNEVARLFQHKGKKKEKKKFLSAITSCFQLTGSRSPQI